MNDRRHLGTSRESRGQYDGSNILHQYHDRGVTNGWKDAQPDMKMAAQPDQTTKTRLVEVTITRTQTATVIIEVLNANEADASTEARYFLQRNPHLLDGVTEWSEPTAYGYGKPTNAPGEPLASFCMLEEYARRRDLHKNAVRIPVSFGNSNQEGK